LLNLIAKLLARPRITAWIIKYGRRCPYYHLDGYMGRWWLMPRWLLTKNKNGHWFPRSWVPFCIRLHHIQAPDAGTVLHDHPANYRSFILKGAYLEIRPDKPVGSYCRVAGETIAAKAEQFHRINWVPFGGVWTIFIMGRRRQEWGFLVEGRKIPWREYLKDDLTIQGPGSTNE
jgi:hypothetical protein